MDKLLSSIILTYKSEVQCGIDTRLLILNTLQNKNIPDKDKKIFLSILFNANIGEDLELIMEEYNRLSQLDDPWNIREQNGWYK